MTRSYAVVVVENHLVVARGMLPRRSFIPRSSALKVLPLFAVGTTASYCIALSSDIGKYKEKDRVCLSLLLNF